ncbi:unnamed protein product, partial [Ixodes pacificus]
VAAPLHVLRQRRPRPEPERTEVTLVRALARVPPRVLHQRELAGKRHCAQVALERPLAGVRAVVVHQVVLVHERLGAEAALEAAPARKRHAGPHGPPPDRSLVHAKHGPEQVTADVIGLEIGHARAASDGVCKKRAAFS